MPFDDGFLGLLERPSPYQKKFKPTQRKVCRKSRNQHILRQVAEIGTSSYGYEVNLKVKTCQHDLCLVHFETSQCPMCLAEKKINQLTRTIKSRR